MWISYTRVLSAQLWWKPVLKLDINKDHSIKRDIRKHAMHNWTYNAGLYQSVYYMLFYDVNNLHTISMNYKRYNKLNMLLQNPSTFSYNTFTCIYFLMHIMGPVYDKFNCLFSIISCCLFTIISIACFR